MKNANLINFKVVRYTQANGKEDLEMDLENSNGLMELNILVNGKITKLMGKVNLFISMEIFMKAFGLMIKLTVKVFTNI